MPKKNNYPVEVKEKEENREGFKVKFFFAILCFCL